MVYRSSRRALAGLAVAVAAATSASAAWSVETPLKVGEPLARFALLKPGTHRYLRYIVHGDERTLVDI